MPFCLRSLILYRTRLCRWGEVQHVCSDRISTTIPFPHAPLGSMNPGEICITRLILLASATRSLLGQLQPGNLKLAMRVCQPAALDA